MRPESGTTFSVPPTDPVPSLRDGVEMPFRTREEAIDAWSKRRIWEEQRAPDASSTLEGVLRDASLLDSRLGLANWPQLEETEDLNLGHFTFPISPFHTVTDDGDQQFILFSNTVIIANFRHREYLERIHRRIYDRAVAGMARGRQGSAVVEFDRPISDEKVERIVRLLSYCGVNTIIWGNELNDPNAVWRDDLPSLFEIFTRADQTRRQYHLDNLELSLPALAYYGHGEYLEKMLVKFKELQRKRAPQAPNTLPVQRVADHYYGPVDDLLPRIKRMREIMAAQGAGDLKFDLTEVGNPTTNSGMQRATDTQLAEGFIPQVSSIAIGSGLVDRVRYYSLLDGDTNHSVMKTEDGQLSKKPQYQSLVVMAKLLARLGKVSLVEEKEKMQLVGSRTDGIDFQVVWSKLSDRDLPMDVPNEKRIFDVLGREIKPDRPGQLLLHPRQHPALAGAARILIARTR